MIMGEENACLHLWAERHRARTLGGNHDGVLLTLHSRGCLYRGHCGGGSGYCPPQGPSPGSVPPARTRPKGRCLAAPPVADCRAHTSLGLRTSKVLTLGGSCTGPITVWATQISLGLPAVPGQAGAPQDPLRGVPATSEPWWEEQSPRGPGPPLSLRGSFSLTINHTYLVLGARSMPGALYERHMLYVPWTM